VRARRVRVRRKRFPHLPFETADIQDRNILQLGRFDFVPCCGLLYHLENPLLAMRNLRALTEKCLLLESMCIPDEKPSMLLREEPRADDQSLTDVACYPSEGALVKMLYRVGFATVYRVAPLPEHDDFRDTAEHARKRTVLLASSAPTDIAGFRLYPEPREAADPWNKMTLARPSVQAAHQAVPGEPGRRKYITLALRARRVFPEMAIPLRLDFGAWWLAEKGELDHELMYKRVRRDGDTIRAAAAAAGDDRAGHWRASRVVHFADGEARREAREGDYVRAVTTRMPAAGETCAGEPLQECAGGGLRGGRSVRRGGSFYGGRLPRLGQ
jgi:hypothetical protein